MASLRPVARYLIALSPLLTFSCSQEKAMNQNAPPLAPSNLTARAASPFSVVLEWNDNSNNETCFVVYGPSFEMPPDPFWIRGVLPSNSTSFIDTLPFDSTEYSYFVIASNSFGNSAPSDTVSVTTMGVGQPPVVPFDPSPADSARNVDISPLLTWQCSDPDGDDLLYYLYFGTESEPSLTNIMSPSPSFELDTLEFSTTYFWRVSVRDGHHHETLSSIWSFTTHLAP